VPDEAGLEQIAQELKGAVPGAVLDRTHKLGRAEILIDPAQAVPVVQHLHDRGYKALSSLHGLDYYPHEPRLAVVYELLDMHTVDRISVKARMDSDDPKIGSIVGIWPGADFPEREAYDMFGIVFEGHPDLRRILMPEDYEGWPQRRDFPTGGEPVLFTYNERNHYGEYQ
jgi:NADH-quinone oxidoreductase subunit C